MSQAFLKLHAERRWVCSGTPIINSADDLGSLLAFLRLCTPLDDWDSYSLHVSRPLSRDKVSTVAVGILQEIREQVILRRTKQTKDSNGNVLLPLPPVEYYQCPITLDQETRELYDRVHGEVAEELRHCALWGTPSAVGRRRNLSTVVHH